MVWNWFKSNWIVKNCTKNSPKIKCDSNRTTPFMFFDTRKESRIHFTPIFHLIHLAMLTDAFVSPSVVRFGCFPRRTSNGGKTSTRQECTWSDMNTSFERVYLYKSNPFYLTTISLWALHSVAAVAVVVGLRSIKTIFSIHLSVRRRSLSLAVVCIFSVWLFFSGVERVNEQASERALSSFYCHLFHLILAYNF